MSNQHNKQNKKVPSKSTKKIPSRSQSPKDEERFLIQRFFSEIDKRNQGKIDKIETIKYLMQNPQILNAFDIPPQNLNTLVNQQRTKESGLFNLGEFTILLQSNKTKSKTRSPGIANGGYGSLTRVQGPAENVSTCLLNQQQIDCLHFIFQRLDRTQESIVPRVQYIQELRNDINIVKMLHIQAAYIPSIDKILTLDKILSQVEQSYFASNDKDSLTYISWQQFMEFFNSENVEQDKTQIKQKIAYAQLRTDHLEDNVDDQDHLDAPEEIQQLLREQFDLLDKAEGKYCLTQEVSDSIRRHPSYSKFRKEIIRQKAKKYKIVAETLEEVLCRMEVEAPQYISQSEMLAYFTRRGIPKFTHQDIEGNDYLLENMAKSVNVSDSNFHPLSNKPPQKNKDRSNQEDYIDGYDSDPEVHTYQDKLMPRQRVTKQISLKGNLTFSHHSVNKKIPRYTEGEQAGSDFEQSSPDLQRSRSNSFKSQSRRGTSRQGRSHKMKKLKRDYSAGQAEDFDPQFLKNQAVTDNNFNELSRIARKQDFLCAIQLKQGKQFGGRHAKSTDNFEPFTSYLVEKRDKNRSQSIRQRKLQESINRKKQDEESLRTYRIKAQEVPSHVKAPLYEQIKAANEARRQQVKKDSIAITLQKEKPFSFYFRDKSKKDKPQRKNYWEREKFVFKAKKVPWRVRVDLWKSMQGEQDNQRKERVAKHAQQLAMQSKMPLRMEQHERMKQVQQLEVGKGRDQFYSHTHQPMPSKQMPDFERLHTNFQSQLEKKKQCK